MTGHQATEHVGRLIGLRRYPVKSLAGEELSRAVVDQRGLVGDRLWSVRDPDGKLGSGKSTRRFRKMDGLLALTAGYDGEVPVVTFPDGRVVRGDDPEVHQVLSGHVGRPVSLGREAAISHFDEGPIHLVTTSALERLAEAAGSPLDVRRLRPNLVVAADGPGIVEDGWVGRRLRIGTELELEVRARMPRCVMVNLPQVGLEAEPGLLARIGEVHQGDLGVVADVVRRGPVVVGDAVRLVSR